MLWRLFALTTFLLLVGGCTTVSSVALRQPQTGHTVRCEGYWHWNIDTRKAQAQELRQQRCIDDYQQQGYVRILE
jgi:hypothetical protein